LLCFLRKETDRLVDFVHKKIETVQKKFQGGSRVSSSLLANILKGKKNLAIELHDSIVEIFTTQAAQ
jgi:hypothetical protein